MAASVCPQPGAALADVGVVSGGVLKGVLAALCALALRPTWRRRWLLAGSALVALLALAAFALQLGALDASGLVAARDARRDIVAALAALATFEGLHAFAMADGGVLRGPCLGRTVAHAQCHFAVRAAQHRRGRVGAGGGGHAGGAGAAGLAGLTRPRAPHLPLTA